jgi:copper oxidase (laccase) domain-containing protein
LWRVLAAMQASDLLIPDWPAPAGVMAVCSTRRGGVSALPYDSLNLGGHVGDAPASVAENRRRYAAYLGAKPVLLHQVHGWDLVALDSQMPDGLTADASLSTEPGLACTVMVADCLPVLLCRADGAMVGAAHAGWRGLLGQGGRGVLEAVIERFRPQALAGRASLASKKVAFLGDQKGVGRVLEPSAEGVLAWLGPCIGPRAFEVGPEVHQAFTAADAAAGAFFAPHGAGKFMADLAGLARLRLQRLGVERIYGNDGSPDWCTVGNPSSFFSHRRDRGLSGRFAASIWRVSGSVSGSAGRDSR